MNNSYAILIHAARAVALDFVDGESKKRVMFFRADELSIDDPIKLPEGKVVRITFDYCEYDEMLK